MEQLILLREAINVLLHIGMAHKPWILPNMNTPPPVLYADAKEERGPPFYIAYFRNPTQMDPTALVTAILDRPAFRDIGLECINELPVESCAYAMWEATGGPDPQHNSLELRPLGGIFHIQHAPIAFLHCVAVRDSEEEAGHLAECAMFQRATEMFFAGHEIYPVVFLVEGGSPDFWRYLDLYQLGRHVGRQGIYKVAGKYSVPVIVPYTEFADAVLAVEEVVLDSLAALVVPPAER